MSSTEAVSWAATVAMLLLQLDCLSVTSRVYAGMFAVEVRFLIRDQFWIPRPKLHGTKYLIFVNLKMDSFDQFLRFLFLSAFLI